MKNSWKQPVIVVHAAPPEGVGRIAYLAARDRSFARPLTALPPGPAGVVQLDSRDFAEAAGRGDAVVLCEPASSWLDLRNRLLGRGYNPSGLGESLPPTRNVPARTLGTRPTMVRRVMR